MDEMERPYRKASRAKSTFQFVFMPERFVHVATKHDISWSLTSQPDLRSIYEGDASQLAKYEAEIRVAASNRIEAVRRSLFSALRLVSLSALAGLTSGWLLSKGLGPLPSFGNSALQVLGAAILLLSLIHISEPTR